jgi:hypothetical protein
MRPLARASAMGRLRRAELIRGLLAPWPITYDETGLVAAKDCATILWHTARVPDEDQLYLDRPSNKPRPVTEMFPAETIAECLAQLLVRRVPVARGTAQRSHRSRPRYRLYFRRVCL